MQGLVYILVNKTSFSLSTIKLTNNFICQVNNFETEQFWMFFFRFTMDSQLLDIFQSLERVLKQWIIGA